MKNYILERSQVIGRSRREVFAFFSDASNLERITPRFLHFRILTPAPIRISAGTIIDYEIKLFAVPLRWRTLIESWSPEESFVDLQLKGPYAYWRHTHRFTERSDGSTEASDHVEYRMPFGFLGTIVHALVVRRTLKSIFDHRAEMTRRLLDATHAPSHQETAQAKMVTSATQAGV